MIKIQSKLLINGAVQFGRVSQQVKETGGLPENKVDGAGHGSIHSDPIVGDSSEFGFLKKGIGQLFLSLKNQSFGSSFGFPQIGSPLTVIGDISRTIGSIKNSIGNIRNLF